jgi:glycosyltransferase involved in cell wall biosynthesis
MATRGRRATRWLVITNWRDLMHSQAGGAEVVCEQLAQRFATIGHDVILLTASVPGRPAVEHRDGYRIVRRGGRFTVYPWALWWLARHRRRVDAVMDSQNGIPFFTPLVVRRDTPVVMLLHHVHQDQFRRYFSPAVAKAGQWLERSGARFVYGRRAVVAVSPSTRTGARAQLGLRGALWVAPPGWGIEGPPPVHWQRAENPRIVCVGRLVPHKRTRLIVDAMPSVFEAFPNVELHLVGDGPEREFLEQRVTELGLAHHVRVHGAVSSRARDELLSTAWLTVNASHGEGWGLSVVEANGLGVPALAFRRPGLRDSIRDGDTGWLVDDGSDLGAAMSAALAELSDPMIASGYAERARAWVARFTWDEMAGRVLAALAAEAGRLAKERDERREHTDLAVVAHIAPGDVPDGWHPRFRVTDRWTIDDAGLHVLLPGADSESALVALVRAGLPERLVHTATDVEVARPTDFLFPAAGSPAIGEPAGERRAALAG